MKKTTKKSNLDKFQKQVIQDTKSIKGGNDFLNPQVITSTNSLHSTPMTIDDRFFEA